MLNGFLKQFNWLFPGSLGLHFYRALKELELINLEFNPLNLGIQYRLGVIDFKLT